MISRRERKQEQKFLRRLAPPEEAAWPGVLVCLLLTALAAYLQALPYPPFTLEGGQHPLSAVLLALVLGMLVRNAIPATRRLKPGVSWVVKKLLPAGIVLLGARLDFYDLLAVGVRALVAAAVLIVIAVVITWVLSRTLGIAMRLGLLIGVGTAICGTSAIVATAPVIEAEEEDVGFSVATVNLFGVLAMLIFPVLGALFEMGSHTFGAWCGLSIHATPQVIAAGFAHSPTAGEIATIVKLTRVSLLAPAVFLIGALYARERRREAAFVGKPIRYRSLVPGFVVLFLVMAFLRTMGFLPEVTMHFTERFVLGVGPQTFDLAAVLGSAAKWIITAAMAGVGLGIELRSLRAGGARPFLLGLFATIVVAIVGIVQAVILL